MSKIEIYIKTWCPFCAKAKKLLESKGLPYEEFDIESDSKFVTEMRERSKNHTVPQIFIDGKHIGGCDDLHEIDSTGELDNLVSQSKNDIPKKKNGNNL